jgi:hypothetical protein
MHLCIDAVLEDRCPVNVLFQELAFGQSCCQLLFTIIHNDQSLRCVTDKTATNDSMSFSFELL